nr:hypothetical protein HK105_002505 [Polyrhizophydium stewartii]
MHAPVLVPRQKLKCSKRLPVCNACTAANIECTYSKTARKAPQRRPKGYVRDLELKVRSLEAMASLSRALHPGMSAQSASPNATSVSPPPLSAQSQPTPDQTVVVRNFPFDPDSTAFLINASLSASASSGSHSKGPQASSTSRNSDTGQLDTSATSSSSSLPGAFSRLVEIDDSGRPIDDAQVDRSRADVARAETNGFQFEIPTTQARELAHIFSIDAFSLSLSSAVVVPKPERRADLLDIFVKHIHIRQPCFHIRSFLRRFDSFSPFLIYSLYTHICATNFNKAPSAREQGSIYFHVAKSLMPDALTKPSLSHVFSLLMIAHQELVTDESGSMMYVGLAARMAQQLGLFSEAPHLARLPPKTVEQEMRRRIGWLIYDIDRLSSLYTHVPPAIRTNEINLGIPMSDDLWSVCDLPEEHTIQENSARGLTAFYNEAPVFGPDYPAQKTNPPIGNPWIEQAKLTRIYSRITDFLARARSLPEADAKVEQSLLDLSLDQWHRSMEKAIQIIRVPVTSFAALSCENATWHYAFLPFRYAVARIALHLPQIVAIAKEGIEMTTMLGSIGSDIGATAASVLLPGGSSSLFPQAALGSNAGPAVFDTQPSSVAPLLSMAPFQPLPQSLMLIDTALSTSASSSVSSSTMPGSAVMPLHAPQHANSSATKGLVGQPGIGITGDPIKNDLRAGASPAAPMPPSAVQAYLFDRASRCPSFAIGLHVADEAAHLLEKLIETNPTIRGAPHSFENCFLFTASVLLIARQFLPPEGITLRIGSPANMQTPAGQSGGSPGTSQSDQPAQAFLTLCQSRVLNKHVEAHATAFRTLAPMTLSASMRQKTFAVMRGADLSTLIQLIEENV